MSRARTSASPEAAKGVTQFPSAPLPSVDRDYFERRFDADFTKVRVHTGPEAELLAASMGAKAFATGDHIVFGPGRFAPGTTPGKTLLAHELGHVAQQQRGADGHIQAAPPAEQRARTAAATAARGGDVSEAALGQSGPGVQCDEEEKPPGSVLPPMPPLKLNADPLDWGPIRGSYWAHGRPLTLPDIKSVEGEWARSSKLLDTLGINDRFKLSLPFIGTWTKDRILNLGIQKQVEDLNQRENPSGFDRMNQRWDAENPGFKTPIIPLFEKKF